MVVCDKRSGINPEVPSLVREGAECKAYDLGYGGYTYKITDTLEVLRSYLTVFDQNSNIFLQYDYLQAMETLPPRGVRQLYVLVFENDLPLAIHYFQYTRISLVDSLALHDTNGSWREAFRKQLASLINHYVLVAGNTTLTGHNSYAYNTAKDNREVGVILDSLVRVIREYLRKQDIKISAVLVKDFYEGDYPELPGTYVPFGVQPNMRVEHIHRWETVEAYQDSLRSKYRTRYKKARKSLKQIEKKMLDHNDITRYASEIQELYGHVISNASFNLFTLPENYFANLKKYLGERFQLVAYFEEDRMIGFYTYIFNHDEVEAHFLGYDPQKNKRYKIYLNMLYDMLTVSIEERKDTLSLSRTAMEIKSTVGATAADMKLYFRIFNPVYNRLYKTALGYFNPTEDFTLRSPFKE